MDDLRDLYFGVYTVELQATTPLYLPHYIGFEFHGLPGAYKAAAVAKGYEPLSHTMAEPGAGNDLRLGRDLPHAFALTPELGPYERSVPKGGMFRIRLVLFGVTNEKLPYFCNAFERLGSVRGIGQAKPIHGRSPAGGGEQGGRFRLCRVTDETGTVHYEAGTGPTGAAVWLVRAGDVVDGLGIPERVLLRFRTPMRIRTAFRRSRRRFLKPEDGTDLFAFVEAIHRRLVQLTQLFCVAPDAEPRPYRSLAFPAEAPELVDCRTEWHDLDRYSRRQGVMKFGGFVGEIVVRGADIAPYLSLLHLGAKVQAGKHTSMGLGAYDVWSS